MADSFIFDERPDRPDREQEAVAFSPRVEHVPAGGTSIVFVGELGDRRPFLRGREDGGHHAELHRYHVENATADTPPKAIYTPNRDVLARLTLSSVVKTADSGSTYMLTASMTGTVLPGSPAMSYAVTQAMVTVGGNVSEAVCYLQAGIPVIVSATGGSYGAGGSYDFAASVEVIG